MNQGMAQSGIAIRLGIVITAVVALNIQGWVWATESLTRIATAIESSKIPTSKSTDTNDQRLFTDSPDIAPWNLPFGPSARLNVKGISAPLLRQSDEVVVEDDTMVIGGESRSYFLRAFESDHVKGPRDLSVFVVNDTISNRPVSITHCDRTHSTRVLTTKTRSGNSMTPMDLRIGGWANGLLLVFEGMHYLQHEVDIPLTDVEFTKTTWKQWRINHPKTLLYTGEQRRQ